MYYKLAPSILAADFTRLGEQVKEVYGAGAEYLHLDVMDGAFAVSYTHLVDNIAVVLVNPSGREAGVC